ncbi:MAG TPA: TetR/AcrR family transcriptional regulator [Hyphomonadaceae bacterium]|jgi:TetR/AcrR family transcriptional repressor of nem operon|nr:TetR/AcrR family transcriptional regulator [Hyphomonadaceae bacterium]
MRYDAEHKQKTRERVVKEAARAIRKDGPHNLALSSVMANVGLTNGGFYAHFKSRDDLLAAGVEQMFRESRARTMLEGEGRSPAENLNAFLDFYLSAAHRDSRTFGCPLAFLSTEAPRLPKAAARQFADGVPKLAGMIAQQLKALGRSDAEDEASSVLAELVGAVGLSRAEPDKEKSDLILERSRRTVARRLGLEIAQ